MPSEPSLARRVARLENETASIYELITEFKTIQDEHTGRLDRIDTRLDRIDTRLDRIDTRLDRIDTRLDGLDTRFEQADSRFDRVDEALASILRRLPEPR